MPDFIDARDPQATRLTNLRFIRIQDSGNRGPVLVLSYVNPVRMFLRGSNLLISGGVFSHIEGNLNTGAQIAHKGIELLESRVVPGAFHTADENYDAPKCHPNTRLAVLKEILDWLNDTDEPHRAMWMRGAAGAGKSAIARTISQMCDEQGRLSSSFFFSRTASDVRRSDEKYLVATLAYQMMENIPEMRQHISTALLSNRFIFDLGLDAQIYKLIVTPLAQLSDSSSIPVLPKVIIIDGLDECHNKDAQNAIVNAFVAALARMNHNFPHKLLIASRPEQNIQSAFGDRDLAPFLRQLPLDDSWKPDNDIRTFLVDNLAKIRDTHPLRNIIPLDWPAPCDIDKLVEKSSGQFIYAATVSKYIISPRQHPVESLRTIVELVKDPKNRPYAELDALYTYIFASAEDSDLVLQILRVHLIPVVTPVVNLPTNEIHFIRRLLNLGEGNVELALTDLSSIVEIERSQFKFLHASLPDFLLDATRSGRFYANSNSICVHLFRHCLLSIAKYKFAKDRSYVILPEFKGLGHFAESIREAPSEIHDAFSDFDMKASLKATSKLGGMLIPMASFLGFVLREHRKSSSFQTPHIPLKVVSQLQEWISDQLQKLPLDSLDITSDTFAKVLNDPELCFYWSLMSRPELTAFFCDIKLLGVSAMSGNKYAYAALYCCRFIFSAYSVEEDQKVRGRIMRLSARYAPCFLKNAAPRFDVYLSLKKIFGFNSMQEDLRQVSSSYEYRTHLVSHLESHFRQTFLSIFWQKVEWWVEWMNSLVDYMAKTHEAFPSLREQNSAHVQDERDPASEENEQHSACVPAWDKHNPPLIQVPLRDERASSTPSQERKTTVVVRDERRTVQETAERAYHPKSRSNSPMSNATALQAQPRHWYSLVKFKISKRMVQRRQ
ncbi:hypothetical protein BDZ97DRAFT_1924663 [Flammula alnicola]|nr:hypothetical protein BDZ97DRAFT_1924663 [Flammula alnicola]